MFMWRRRPSLDDRLRALEFRIQEALISKTENMEVKHQFENLVSHFQNLVSLHKITNVPSSAELAVSAAVFSKVSCLPRSCLLLLMYQ